MCCTASVIKHGHDIDQLRGKVATAATHEVRKHAAAAAQAVSAAREATMELDKVSYSLHFQGLVFATKLQCSNYQGRTSPWLMTADAQRYC